MEYIGDTDRTLQFLVLYKEKTADLSPSGEAGEGGGCCWWLLNKVLYWEAPPQRSTSYPVYIFNRKGTPTFCITFIDKWDPFHTPSLELNISFNC